MKLALIVVLYIPVVLTAVFLLGPMPTWRFLLIWALIGTADGLFKRGVRTWKARKA